MPSSDLATAPSDGPVRLWLVDLGPHPSKTLGLLRRARLHRSADGARLRGRPGPQQERGCPPIGIVFANTPTGAHQMLMLDYRGCGPEGEPGVVRVDADDDHREVPLAPDLAAFLRGLHVRPPAPQVPGGLEGFEAL